MNRIKFFLLSFSAIVLLAANSVFAQSKDGAVVPDVQVPQTASDIAKLVPQDTYALPWERIMEDNILWKKRVWRDIDVRDLQNEAFAFNHEAPRNTDLTSVLISGFFSGKYKAYSAVDDRFATELSRGSFIDLLSSKNGINPENVTKFRVKEDWLFLQNEHKMVVRIVGIAPVVQVLNADGTTTDQPAFWLYYPDTRSYLADNKVYHGGNAGEMNWDELFESRDFNSRIVKVSEYGGMRRDFNPPAINK